MESIMEAFAFSNSARAIATCSIAFCAWASWIGFRLHQHLQLQFAFFELLICRNKPALMVHKYLLDLSHLRFLELQLLNDLGILPPFASRNS